MKVHSSCAAALAASVAVLSGAMVTTPARGADLGGACCADLEERIAELEATTARKGNRKVSLTVSGYVAQELTYWDDGAEQNAYLHGLGPTQTSHVKFNGQAQIAPGWTAGYMMRLQDLTSNAFGRSGGDAMNQFSDDFSTGLGIQMSYWYLQSKDLGKVSVGKNAQAAKSTAMFTDLSGTQLFDSYSYLTAFPQFILRSDGDLSPPVTWGQVAFCYAQNLPLGGDCNGLVMEGVRYDSPALAGFSFSASWGEDDFWEVAGRYAGEVAGVKLSLGLGYSVNTDENANGVPVVMADKDSEYVQAGGYAQHLATGLFVHGAWGRELNNDVVVLGTGGRQALDGEHWTVKAGIRKAWTPLGATILYGTYSRYEDQLGPAALTQGATSSELERYGAGLAQEIDAAAMTVYLKYHHMTADVAGAPNLEDLDDLDLVSVGGIINF